MQKYQRWPAAGATIMHASGADVNEMATDTRRSHEHPRKSTTRRHAVRVFSTCSAPPMLMAPLQIATPGGGHNGARLGIIGAFH